MNKLNIVEMIFLNVMLEKISKFQKSYKIKFTIENDLTHFFITFTVFNLQAFQGEHFRKLFVFL